MASLLWYSVTVGLFLFQHFKGLQSRGQVADRAFPVFLVEAHPNMHDRHVTARVNHRPRQRRAQKIDQQLLLVRDPVRAPVVVETAQLIVISNSHHQCVGSSVASVRVLRATPLHHISARQLD